jgi:hypothetical protein
VNKREWKLIGAIFGAEVSGRLPYQPSDRLRKTYEGLADQGYCQELLVVIPVPPLGEMSVAGFALTNQGRMLYCFLCEKYAPKEDLA